MTTPGGGLPGLALLAARDGRLRGLAEQVGRRTGGGCAPIGQPAIRPDAVVREGVEPGLEAPWRSPRRRSSGRCRGRPRRPAPARAPCPGTARRRWSRGWCRRSSRGRSAASSPSDWRSCSMSRAVSTVLKVPRASPYSLAQPSATSLVSAKASSSCCVGGRPRLGGDHLLLHVVGDALDRRGQPDAARVEADDVEAAQHVRRQGQRQADRGVGTRGPRAAGVDHQRADPVGLPGHHDPDQEQRQRGALGLVVADRHLGAAALERQVRGRCRAGRRSAAGSACCSRSSRSARPSARRVRSTSARSCRLGDACRRTRCSPTGPGSRRDRGRAGWMGRPPGRGADA